MHLGTPSIFLRFGGCNMQCPGFGTKVKTPNGKHVVGCDTAYAVFRSEFQSTWSEIEGVAQLLEIIKSYDLNYAADIVLTGGEPLIYATDPILIQFLELVTAQGHRVTFETNSAIDIDFERFPIYRKCTYALSVKLENSGEPESRRINTRAIKHLSREGKKSFFKFTIDAKALKETAKEIESIRVMAPKLPVYVMPMSDSKSTIEAACEPVIEFCKDQGYIYSDRLHIRIWDDIKGV